MKDAILDFVQIIIYIRTIWIVTTFFLKEKKAEKKNWKLAIACVFFFLMLIFEINIYLFGIVQAGLIYLLVDSMFCGSKKNKVLLVLSEIGSITNIYQMLSSIIITMANMLQRSVDHEEVTTGSAIIIYFIIFILNKKIKCEYIWNARKIEIRYSLSFMIMVVIEGMFMTTMGDVILQEISTKIKLAFEAMYICIILFMFIQLVLMIALIISRNVYREKEYLAAKYLEDQELHYEYLENRERETKKFRHDIRNHLLIINDLINQRKLEECESYLEEAHLKIDKFSYKISVNNGIADAIVNKFFIEAEQKGIKLQVKGHLPNPCYLPAFDMCTILSNLLSNAVEAEIGAGGECINVQFRYTDTEIMIAVENDYEQELKQKDGKFHTTKNDSDNHGFGLENVKECVKRNHGHITIDTQNCLFKVLVCVNNGDGQNENCYCG